MSCYVDGVKVYNHGAYTDDEIKGYINQVREDVGGAVEEVTLKPVGDKVQIDYATIQRKFERIKRITGYLTGDTKTWNNAKQAEARDRVKHGVDA